MMVMINCLTVQIYAKQNCPPNKLDKKICLA